MAKEAEPLLWAAINRAEATNIRIRLIGFATGSGTPDLQFSGAAHIAGSISGERIAGETDERELGLLMAGVEPATRAVLARRLLNA